MCMNGKTENIISKIKVDILRMFFNSKKGHLASALSCIDILAVLYLDIKQNIDKVILSKGHAAAALYAIFKELGYISEDELTSFYGTNSKLIALASNTIEEIYIPTGSLGQGICFASGIAKGYKIDRNNGYVYCVLGDGEMQEGSVWETAMFASKHNLDNFIVILDNNKIQGSDTVSAITNNEPIHDKWNSFGWNVYEVDGHCASDIKSIIIKAKRNANPKPSIIIAHTIKGKGISFIENKSNCHMLNPNGDEWSQVCKEFNISLEELKGYER